MRFQSESSTGNSYGAKKEKKEKKTIWALGDSTQAENVTESRKSEGVGNYMSVPAGNFR